MSTDGGESLVGKSASRLSKSEGQKPVWVKGLNQRVEGVMGSFRNRVVNQTNSMAWTSMSLTNIEVRQRWQLGARGLTQHKMGQVIRTGLKPGNNISRAEKQWNAISEGALLYMHPLWRLLISNRENMQNTRTHTPSQIWTGWKTQQFNSTDPTSTSDLTCSPSGERKNNHNQNKTKKINKKWQCRWVQTDTWPRLLLGGKTWELDQPARQTHVWTPCQLGTGQSQLLIIFWSQPNC